MSNQTASLQKTARFAGFLYFLVAVFSFFSIMYVPSQIMVKGEAARTFQNLLTHEFLFRAGITANLVNFVVFLFLAFFLYKLFRPIDEPLSKILLVSVAVQLPVVFVMEAFNFSALMVAKEMVYESADVTQKQDMAMLLLKLNDYGTIILMLFWGIWLIPFGQLALKSGYLPKVIGIFLIAGGIAYILECLDYILLDRKLSFITNYTSFFHSVAEISTVVWLLVKGVQQKHKEAAFSK
mgnify:CR=1 FL=1